MTIYRGPSNDRLLHPAARRIRRSSATGAHPVRGVGLHAAHPDGQMLEQHRQVTQRLESIEPVRLRWMATADEGSCAEVAARYEDLSAVLNVQLRREVTEVMPADRRELFKEIPAPVHLAYRLIGRRMYRKQYSTLFPGRPVPETL